jgi:dephospho-CoA kinase
MHIILISGYAGSGKDTLADIITKYGYKKYSVADNVKKYSSSLHGFSYDLTQSQIGKRTIVKSEKTNEVKTVRDFLISDSLLNKTLNNDEAYWAKQLSKEILQTSPDKVVISDWRYIEEYEHLKIIFPEAAFLKVRVKRACVKPMLDPSEHQLDLVEYDIEIDNSKDKISLIKDCDELLRNLNSK